MEYEATFVDGVMVRYDASRLRLAALRSVQHRVCMCVCVRVELGALFWGG